MSAKTKNIIGWILTGLLTLVMIGSAFGKFTATPDSEMGLMFIANGIYDARFLIGSLEVLCAILMLIPRTSTVGMVLAGGYWGGAIATHISHGQSPATVLVFVALMVVIALLRNPELFSRLLGKETKA
jgi:hypothetical protein